TQQAQLDQSVGEYNQTLLDAVREVADVVANWRALERETTEQQIALEAAQRSYDLTSERYRAGLDNYLSVLSSQNQVIQAQGGGARLHGRVRRALVVAVREPLPEHRRCLRGRRPGERHAAGERYRGRDRRR